MYNLNYLYLHDLDIDQSTSFRDISAIALFVGTQSSDFYTPLSSVTNKFVEWFFGVDNPLKSDIDITLKYAYFNKDTNTTATTDDDAIIPYSELIDTLAPRLELLKDNLLRLLTETCDALNEDTTMPFGTVVINNESPPDFPSIDGIDGEWLKYDKRFILEASGLDGKTAGPHGPASTSPDTGAPLSSILATITSMPEHYHEVELSPASKYANSTISGSSTTNQRFLQPSGNFPIAVATNENHNSDYKTAYASSGYSGDGFHADILEVYVDKCEKEYLNTFKISPTGPRGNVYKQINPVPKPYSITRKAIPATDNSPGSPELSPAIFVKTKITS